LRKDGRQPPSINAYRKLRRRHHRFNFQDSGSSLKQEASPAPQCLPLEYQDQATRNFSMISMRGSTPRPGSDGRKA
jgi:hypothetical protein